MDTSTHAVGTDEETDDKAEKQREPWAKRLGYGAAREIDAVGPDKWGELAWNWYYKRLKKRAATDSEWAAIEARRHNDNGTITFLSEDLTWADHETQRTIERRLSPEPWWVRTLRQWGRWSATRKLGAKRNRRERAKRGWGHQDLWSLDDYLVTVTGQMLAKLAEVAHGWPGNEEFQTFEDWKKKLASVSEALLGYGGGTEHDEMVDAWHTLASSRGSDPEAVKAASEAMHAEEVRRYEAAKDAMAWVAQHLGQLWD